MQTPHDPREPHAPGTGHKVDPRDPWGTGSSSAHALQDPVDPPIPGRDTKDPGTPGARSIAWVLVLVLFGLTFFMTQCEGKGSKAPAEAVAVDPNSEQSVVMGAMFVKLGRAFEGMSPGSSGEVLKALDEFARDSQEPLKDSLRTAIVAAELTGPTSAIDRLDAVERGIEAELAADESTLTPEQAESLTHDSSLLKAIYGGNLDGLTQDERDGLVTRHGRLGSIALTFGLPASDPVRAALVEGGGTLVAVLLGFLGLILLVIPASLVCATIAIVRMTKPGKKTAFVPPTPGGSVYIEMLAIFLFSFILLKLAIGLVAAMLGPGTDPGTIMTVGLIAQWPVALVVLWPLLRGVPLAEHARRVGWTRGKGIVREILAGIFGYLAGLPLLFAAFALTMLVIIIQSAIEHAAGGTPTPPNNPILEVATSGGITPFLLFALAVIWAPFTEETIFRGSLFRHLRSRRGLLLSAAVSALFFGLIHPYSPALMLPVITLGFNFALMREWRGSLIAPITAHALHNGTIMTLLLLVLSQIG